MSTAETTRIPPIIIPIVIVSPTRKYPNMHAHTGSKVLIMEALLGPISFTPRQNKSIAAKAQTTAKSNMNPN